MTQPPQDPTRYTVRRDPAGIPHVHAPDETTLAEGQGYATARDRAWQIETDRWRAEARLSAHLGPAGRDWDVLAVRVRLPDTAARAHAALDPTTRAWVDAYTRGVRHGLADTGDDVPELTALADPDGPVPGPWPGRTPWPDWAPLGVFHVAHVLFSGFPHLLWRDHVVRTLGPAHPDVPPDVLADLFTADGGPGAGSNAWAVHGSRTAGGLPLLAGDPHRLLELPGVYQQVRLSCPAYDVLGLAFPGAPGVPHVAHTGHAAWGITNAMAHHVDVYREHLRPAGQEPDGTHRVEALGPDGWEPATTGTTTVHVRHPHGLVPEEVGWVETARGVVVTGIDDAGRPLGDDGPPAYSVRLAARVDADLGTAATRALLHARTADDVARAFAGWVDPVHRVLAADTDGTVLSLTAGRVPDRAPRDRRLPLDARDPDTRPGPWHTLPPPRVVDAATGVAVDANQRPEHPEHDLGHAYAPPHRARRVRALVEAAGDRQTANDQTRVHADTRAGGADALLDHLRAAHVRRPHPDAATRARRDQALRRLLDWDRHMDAGSTGAAAFAAWRGAVVRRLVAHPALVPLGAPHGLGGIFDPWFSVPGRVADALPALLLGPHARALGTDPDDLVLAALDDVAGDPRTGEDAPRWGDTHRLLPLHLLLDVPAARATPAGAVPAVPSVPSVPSVPLSGDTDCVRSTSSNPGISDLCVKGSVARWVWDLADRDRSRWGVPFGAHGDPRHPCFADQHAAWVAATTPEVVTDPARLRLEIPQEGRP